MTRSIDMQTVSLKPEHQSFSKHFPGAPDGTNIQNGNLDGQQQRQGHHTTSWTKAQSKTLGSADDAGSTVEQARSHLDEQAGYAGKRGRHDDKTCASRNSG